MAATGTGEGGVLRALAMFEAGADAVAVDTAHGHSHGVLDTVREIGAEDNTIVAVTGDHGYGLGELGSWGKCASAFPPLVSFLAALKWRSGDRHAAGARNTCPHHYLRAVTQPRG